MAIINELLTITTDGLSANVDWIGLTSADNEGRYVELVDFPDRSVQVEGDFDGATVSIQGSNNGVDYHTLKDSSGNNVEFTASGLKQIVTISSFIRPITSGGGAAQLVDVFLLSRRN